MDDRQEKEEYVRKHILDPEAFSRHLSDQRGDDLDQYTFEELQDLVASFNQSPSTQRDTVPESFPQMPVDNPPNTLRCREFPASPLATQTIQVQVLLGDSIKAMFRTHQLYTILTSPLDWSVQRKYSDFLWLRNKLQQTFPHQVVPILPSLKDKLEEGKSSTKLKFLNLFASYLVSSAVLKTHPCVLGFLQEPNLAQFKRLRKQARHEKRPRKVHEFGSANGELQCSFEDNSDYYAASLRKLYNFEDQLKQLTRQARTIVDKTNELHSALSCFFLLADKLATFEWEEPSLTSHMQNYCRTVSETFSVISRSQMHASALATNHISTALDFASEQIQPLKMQLKQVQTLRTQHLKALHRKETRVAAQKPVKESKLAALKQMEEKYGVLNSALRAQLTEVNEFWLKALTDDAKDFLLSFSDSQASTHTALLQLSKTLG